MSPREQLPVQAVERGRGRGEAQRPRATGRWRSPVAACVDRCSACTPQPVPRSSAVPTGRRMVAPARVVDAPPTPSTWSACSGRPGPGARRQVGERPTSRPYGSRSTPARSPSPYRLDQPGRERARPAAAGPARRRRPPPARSGPQMNSRISVSSGSRRAVAPQRGRGSRPGPAAAVAAGPSRCGDAVRWCTRRWSARRAARRRPAGSSRGVRHAIILPSAPHAIRSGMPARAPGLLVRQAWRACLTPVSRSSRPRGQRAARPQTRWRC